MKFAHLLAVTVVLATGFVFSLFAGDGDISYVEIKIPFAKIYVRHDDPKGLNSDIIRLAKKGEYLELLSKGESWYKVRVDGKDGFLQAKDGRVVNRKGAPVITLLLYIVILLCCAGGVVLYLKKSQGLAPR